MPEEFLQGGVCGGSSSSCWINPSTNLFNSSPFGWPSHDQPTIDPKTARSGSIDSGAGSAVSDGSGSVVLMDDGSNNWNPNLLHHNNNYSSMNMIDNCYGQNSFHHQFNSYGYNNNNSSLLQTLFVDTDSQSNHLRQSLSTNYLTNNQAGLCLSFGKLDSMNNDNHLQFNNNSTATSTPDFLASSQPQSVLQSKPILNSFHTKKNKQESKKVSNEPSFKRPRTETPSPLPTFKVRKEKMGDRITALQQLVSPFGKTDTASVLHEATEYIKFLHDQVGVLTTPYLKNGSTQVQHQHDQQNNVKGETDELQSRGLCLVPISSTFPVAAEAAVTDQLWTPNLGGYFR